MRHVTFLLCLSAIFCAGGLHAQTHFADTMQMQEVVIRSNNAIYWSKDTTVYVADSFNHSPHNMAEDVLKKLPGVDVSMDGKISVEGKEVKRIFINGKEAGVNDIRNLTQNLPANIIDRIQLSDYQSEESLALGLKEPNTEKIINLKLKEEYDHGVYGRAAAGTGNGGLYQGSLFSNYMAGATRVTLIGYGNNTGNADISGSGPESMQGSSRSAGTMKQGNGNASYSFKTNDDKLDVSGSAEIGQRNNTTEQLVLRRTFLPGDSTLFQNQHSSNDSKGLYAHLNTRATYTFSKRTSINTNLSLNQSVNKPTQASLDTTAYNEMGNYSFARNSTTVTEDANPSVAFSAFLQHNSRKQGRNFILRYNLAYATSSRENASDAINTYNGTAATSFNNTRSVQKGHNIGNTVSLKAAEPISENSLLSAEYSLQLYTSKDTRDVNAENNLGSYHDTVQSNTYEYDFNEHNIGLQYQYSYGNTTINAGFKAQPFERSNKNIAKAQESVYSGINYFPLAGFRYQLSKRWRMDANYNGSMRAPSINQVQPAPDYSDSLNIIVGNPNLKPEITNGFNLSANYLHPVKERSLWMRLGYNRIDDRIVNNVTLSANKRITMPVNADGSYTGNASLGYSSKWKKKYRLKLGMNAGLGKNVTITNNVKQQVSNYFYQPNAGVNVVTEMLETELDYSMRSSYTSGSTITSNNRLLTHTLSLDSKLNLPGQITISVNVDYMMNKGLSAGFDQSYVVANAGIYKGFNKPDGLYIKLQGYDLLNNYPNTRRTVYDNVIEDRSFNRIGRYFLVSIIYRFNHFF